MTNNSLIGDWAAAPENGVTMPMLFIGHGSPMNAIEDTDFSRAWAEMGRSIPVPTAVLCISAHWTTTGTRVTAMERPRTIHDFHGFPAALHRMQYPAPGSPELARMTVDLLKQSHARAETDWGLDHGAWSVLCRMFPDADVPVVQLSLDERLSPEAHYELGRELRRLRRKGVLILGSGNIVHNLGEVVWRDSAYDWATEFDHRIARGIESGDHETVIRFPRLGRAAELSVPTTEHFLPLLYVLGAKEESDPVSFFAEKVTLGAISMRSLRVG